MNSKAVGVLATLGVLAVVGLVVWAAVQSQRWTQACIDAGGKVERRWEYASLDMQYIYGSKGEIIGVIPITTQHYSYHCWVNRQEIFP